MASAHSGNGPCRSSYLLLTLFFVLSLLSSVNAYFIVTQPSASSSWANGSPYPLSWSKGLLDGVDSFDIELTRLNENGIYWVAKNVPSTYTSINVLLQDVPEGDDYFAICLNSTHGLIYAVSGKFSVANSTVTKNPSPNPAAPTVTISGTPNPSEQFVATLGPAINSGSSLIFGSRIPQGSGVLGFGGVLVLCAVFFGGAITLS